MVMPVLRQVGVYPVRLLKEVAVCNTIGGGINPALEFIAVCFPIWELFAIFVVHEDIFTGYTKGFLDTACRQRTAVEIMVP